VFTQQPATQAVITIIICTRLCGRLARPYRDDMVIEWAFSLNSEEAHMLFFFKLETMRLAEYYKLDYATLRTTPCDMDEWAKAFKDKRRHLWHTTNEKTGVYVSTVFLGMNHQYTPGGPPDIFETMVFNGAHDSDCWRCATHSEAQFRHEITCKEVFGDTVTINTIGLVNKNKPGTDN